MDDRWICWYVAVAYFQWIHTVICVYFVKKGSSGETTVLWAWLGVSKYRFQKVFFYIQGVRVKCQTNNINSTSVARGTGVRKQSSESSNMHWTSESLDKDMNPKRWDRPLLIEYLHWLWWINHSKWWTVFFVDYLRRDDKMLVMWEIWWSTPALLHARLKLYRFTEKDRWRASRLCTPVN